MESSVNKFARPEQWQNKAAAFVAKVWSYHDAGYGFLCARRSGSARWQQLALPVACDRLEIEEFFVDYHRDEYDLYFTPCSFARKVRLSEFALASRFAWVDVDDADPRRFDPEPNVLWRTSPGRHQALWIFSDVKPAEHAAACSRMLAYENGADRNGWSTSKVLRVPYTRNHKPEYDLPMVRVVYGDWEHQIRPTVPVLNSRSDHKVVGLVAKLSDSGKARTVFEKYWLALHPRVRALIRTKHATEADRSKCIFEVIAGLHDAGAGFHEIAAVVGANAYFLDKHGESSRSLTNELRRVLGKLGGAENEKTKSRARSVHRTI